MCELGDAYMTGESGIIEEGINLFVLANKEMHRVSEKIRLKAAIAGVAATYEVDPLRHKKIWDSSTRNMEGWRDAKRVITEVFHRKELELDGYGGGQDAWAEPLGVTPVHVGTGMFKQSMVQQRLTADFNLYSRLSTWVEDTHNEGESEVATLTYIRSFWKRISEVEERYHYCNNLIILKQHLVMKEFVIEHRCVEPDEMWRVGLGRSNGAGSKRGGGAGGGRGAHHRGPGGDREDDAAGNGHEVGHPKFGYAPRIQAYKSHVRDLTGKPYVNSDGDKYRGSMCDKCEEEGASHLHHPLRCDKAFPGWKQKGQAPELRGITTFYVRGGKVGKLGDTSA
jgi:hypothetical protein